MSDASELGFKLVFNPRAGRGRAVRSVRAAERELARAGLRFELAPTARAGAGVEAASSARREGFGAVVAIGGDGTVHEVVNGLDRARLTDGRTLPLAVLPAGSGDDFATVTGCPRDERELVRVLREPRVRRIDLGLATIRTTHGVERRVFDNTLGAGFEARVNRESQGIRVLRGSALYLLAVARALRQLEPASFRLAWEAPNGTRCELERELTMVTAGNGPRSGGGFYLTPSSKHDDGVLELGVVGRLSRMQLLWLLPKVLAGRHIGHPAVRIETCRRFELSSSVPFPVHADGEFVDAEVLELEVELAPGRLELWV